MTNFQPNIVWTQAQSPLLFYATITIHITFSLVAVWLPFIGPVFSLAVSCSDWIYLPGYDLVLPTIPSIPSPPLLCSLSISLGCAECCLIPLCWFMSVKRKLINFGLREKWGVTATWKQWIEIKLLLISTQVTAPQELCLFTTYSTHYRVHVCLELDLLSWYIVTLQMMISNMTLISLLVLVYFIISEMIWSCVSSFF